MGVPHLQRYGVAGKGDVAFPGAADVGQLAAGREGRCVEGRLPQHAHGALRHHVLPGQHLQVKVGRDRMSYQMPAAQVSLTMWPLVAQL